MFMTSGHFKQHSNLISTEDLPTLCPVFEDVSMYLADISWQNGLK